MKLSKHFARSEFACKCGCGFDTVDAVLIQYLEAVRNHFNCPVVVTSGCRCDSYNRSIGGSTNSQHVKGRAADIMVKDVEPLVVQEFVNGLVQHGGVGSYSTFTHIDSRGYPARWEG